MFNFFSNTSEWDEGIRKRVVDLYYFNQSEAKNYYLVSTKRLDLRIDDVILGYLAGLVEGYFIKLDEINHRSKLNETIKQVLKTLLPEEYKNGYDRVLNGLQREDTAISFGYSSALKDHRLSAAGFEFPKAIASYFLFQRNSEVIFSEIEIVNHSHLIEQAKLENFFKLPENHDVNDHDMAGACQLAFNITYHFNEALGERMSALHSYDYPFDELICGYIFGATTAFELINYKHVHDLSALDKNIEPNKSLVLSLLVCIYGWQGQLWFKEFEKLLEQDNKNLWKGFKFGGKSVFKNFLENQTVSKELKLHLGRNFSQT